MTVEPGHHRIGQVRTGQRVTVTGVLRSVTLHPRADRAAVDADLFDGTGSLTLRWWGRRTIRGVSPGRHLVAHGRVVHVNGGPALLNPRYELRPDPSR